MCCLISYLVVQFISFKVIFYVYVVEVNRKNYSCSKDLHRDSS